MPDTLARVTMQHLSGITADVTVTDFSFLTGDTDANIAAALVAFYNVGRPGFSAVSQYIGPVVSRAVDACEIKLYNVDTPGKLSGADPLGSPRFVGPFTLAAAFAGVTGLPAEVALALSFRADYAGAVEEAGLTRPRARRRGRVFIGPLHIAAQSAQANNEVRPVAQFKLDLLDAAQALRDDAHFPTNWAVWSRADSLFRAVSVISVDDAFDTQRRRGERATSKVVG